MCPFVLIGSRQLICHKKHNIIEVIDEQHTYTLIFVNFSLVVDIHTALKEQNSVKNHNPPSTACVHMRLNQIKTFICILKVLFLSD